MADIDTVYIPLIFTGNVSGPALYSSGGFTLDLTASLSFIRFLSLEIEVRGASLKSDEYEVLLNFDAAGAFKPGKATIKLLSDMYDRFTIGAVSGQPGSVTVRASKFAAANTTGSSHTHSINHDHPSATSGTPIAGGVGVDSLIASSPIAGHTHSVDIPAFTGTSGAQTHTHDRSFEYDHIHPIGTVTDTASNLIEIPNNENVSTTTWRYIAVGD